MYKSFFILSVLFSFFSSTVYCQTPINIGSLFQKKTENPVVKRPETWYEKEIRLERIRRERIKRNNSRVQQKKAAVAQNIVESKQEPSDVVSPNIVIFNSKVSSNKKTIQRRSK